MATLPATVPQNDTERQALVASMTERRVALGWSQNEWARRAGYGGRGRKSVGAVSRVLSGKQKAIRMWARLEAALRRGEAAARRRKAA